MSESGGAIVERHPTLTGRDSYATRMGLFGWRAAHAITYHKSTGEHRRVTVTPKIKINSWFFIYNVLNGEPDEL